jgi:hypothetical protein
MNLLDNKYQLKQLTSDEVKLYEINIAAFESLGEQLAFIEGLVTCNEEEEIEKAQYVLLVNEKRGELAKSIIFRFYDSIEEEVSND